MENYKMGIGPPATMDLRLPKPRDQRRRVLAESADSDTRSSKKQGRPPSDKWLAVNDLITAMLEDNQTIPMYKANYKELQEQEPDTLGEITRA